ncbi:SDR family NAD(P)-dependent oxidoreductase [Novosphingobium sp. TH158]|uniref:SDR family NAD(P)-dependent oxidoreductase n=1 Tax=Novosphingobium sp. TH158 TaxID=2067455 RepID=UPI000C79B265|nr:SDR family NAD(P)-dependent oxidoreductase [Novosphingobium sp. TH158]PLK26141.1 short-chain dehydrogenase [Novosphingobium sp. TH158]
MTRSLNGKVAVITGAGSGMGRSMALRLAEDNAKIAVWDINGEGAEETARLVREAGGTAIAIQADCSDAAAIKAAAEQTRRELGPILILVNNAGIAPFNNFLEISEELLTKVLKINLVGPFLVSQECVPDMIAAKWGRIINITSSSVQSGSALQTHYTSSKGGLLGLTKCLAMALGEHGITCNMIPPGSIDTPMLRAADVMQQPGAIEAYGKALPVGRIGQGEDIAAAAAFLASEEAGYMTGQTISVNGGRYMGSA